MTGTQNNIQMVITTAAGLACRDLVVTGVSAAAGAAVCFFFCRIVIIEDFLLLSKNSGGLLRQYNRSQGSCPIIPRREAQSAGAALHWARH
jgi:hypothetical protein